MWTSYPGGTWSDNGGQHYGAAHFDMISRTETERGCAKCLGDAKSRISLKDMQDALPK